MEAKSKDAGKTKDALKQLQAEMRQLQALVLERSGPPAPKSDAAGEEAAPAPPAASHKGKGEAVVQYSIHRPPAAEGDAPFQAASSVTAAQIARTTDEATALLGYALSSPQKVALLRALLGGESESASALGATAQLSTGSLYHHLRDLMHAGLLAQAGRNQYGITPRGRRVLLLLLALASEG